MRDGPHRVSMASADQAFLLGDARWFGSGPLPARLPHEVVAPDAWSGWRRQRLKPGLVGFLFPAAWSVFFLSAGLIPMMLHALGHGIGMDLRLGISLFVGAFVVLWLGASMISLNQTEGSPAKMLMWNLIRIETVLLGVLAWIVYNQPVGSLAILAMLITIPLWLSHVVRIATLLAWPPGRWLLPIAHVNIGLSNLDSKWVSESKRWARRPLARRQIGSGEMGDTHLEMVIFGVREGNQDFIAIHLVHPSGAIIDPFVGPSVGHNRPFSRLGRTFADVPNVVAIRELIGSPPVSPVIAEWPATMRSTLGQEEE
jgi:hypothetical protein